MQGPEFTYRGARSGSTMFGLSLVVLIETVALHILVRQRHPLFAWSLMAGSVLILVWLASDYRALGRGRIKFGTTALDLRIGRRFKVEVEYRNVEHVLRPTWQDLPTPGPDATDYRNLMKPASPNVLIVLTAPAALHLFGGVTVHARRLGLHLDDPAGFVAALNAVRRSNGRTV